MRLLSYLFYPVLPAAGYSTPFIVGLLVLSGVLLGLSYILKVWRKKSRDSVARKLSGSWPTAAFWFGIVALLFTVARAEGVQVVGMRVWWLVWALAAAFYLFVQIRMYRMRHYAIVPTVHVSDERDRYLPGKKK